MDLNQKIRNRCFVTSVKSLNESSNKLSESSNNLLTLEGEHDFEENETVIAIAEKDFNKMQELLEDRRKRINSFEVMLEELKIDQNSLILQQQEKILKLDEECLVFHEQTKDLKFRLDELYSIYDDLNLKYKELEDNFTLDEQMKNKLEEFKQMLSTVYNLKKHHPIGYIKNRIPQNRINLVELYHPQTQR